MFDVTALGELLIDFTPCGLSQNGMRVFEQNPGGAPANVLCVLSILGKRTAFIGKVGQDMHGDFLCETLEAKGVDISGLIRDPDVFTTLAFVSLTEKGERSFSFARKPGADTCLRPDELKSELLDGTKIFHFGSLSLTNEPSRSATIAAIQAAKKAGAFISYDPNYRPPLWGSRGEAIAQMRSVLEWVDIVKISDEETALITGSTDPEAASDYLLDMGISCAAVTLGNQGVYVRTKKGSCTVGVPDAPVVDTTGAGDAFWGGFLYKLLESGRTPCSITVEDARDYAAFANAVATLCIQKRGAIPAIPSLEDAMALYREIVK